MATNCVNCMIFGWEQPDLNVLKICTGCRSVWYCDKVCQKEHWYNEHKNQCKYLAKKKVKLNAKHDEATCLVCKDEHSIGKKEMSKQSNPLLPCIMSEDNINIMNMNGDIATDEGMLSMVLPEMSGNFHNKAEAIVAIMMRILVKMKLIKHPLWQCPLASSVLDELYRSLWKTRKAIWEVLMKDKKPGPLQGQMIMDQVCFSLIAADGWPLRLKIQSQEMHLFDGPTVFAPMKTLKVLTVILCEGYCVQGMYIVDSMRTRGLLGLLHKERRGARITFDQFQKMLYNVLNMLNRELVPFNRLVVDGLCNGVPEQICNVCEGEVNVRDSAGVYQPLESFLYNRTYSLCQSDKCLKDRSKEPRTKSLGTMLLELYIRLTYEYDGEFCDYCGKLNHEVRGHRCAGCKTKIYCGLECLNKDTVHLMLCDREKVDERRRKKDSEKRMRDGRLLLRELLEEDDSNVQD